MKQIKSVTVAALILLISISPAIAGGSASHFSQGTHHSTQAAGHSVAMSGKAVAGSVALPLAVVGMVGKISGQVSNDLWDIANRPVGRPLPISKETLTIGRSPKEALFNKRKQK